MLILVGILGPWPFDDGGDADAEVEMADRRAPGDDVLPHRVVGRTYSEWVPLKGLSPAEPGPGLDVSQRFLAGSFDSVGAILATLDTVREIRKQAQGDIRGRLPENEADLLRAAIVFTGAGLDATLKQLIRDTLPLLLEISSQAHDKFERFAADRLGTGEIADAKIIARYLTSRDRAGV